MPLIYFTIGGYGEWPCIIWRRGEQKCWLKGMSVMMGGRRMARRDPIAEDNLSQAARTRWHRSFKANKCYIKTTHNFQRHPVADIFIVLALLLLLLLSFSLLLSSWFLQLSHTLCLFRNLKHSVGTFSVRFPSFVWLLVTAYICYVIGILIFATIR